MKQFMQGLERSLVFILKEERDVLCEICLCINMLYILVLGWEYCWIFCFILSSNQIKIRRSQRQPTWRGECSSSWTEDIMCTHSCPVMTTLYPSYVSKENSQTPQLPSLQWSQSCWLSGYCLRSVTMSICQRVPETANCHIPKKGKNRKVREDDNPKNNTF